MIKRLKIANRKSLRIVLHVLFWILAYAFFIVFYGRANRDYQATIVFATMLFPLSIVTTYFTNYYLIPRYLYTKKYASFILFSFYTLIFSIWSELMITMFVFTIISNYELYKMDPSSYDAVFLFVGLYFIVIIATAIMQVRRSFVIQKQNSSIEKKRVEAELKLKEAELKLLKAQIHPHFLFNTLNNLYGLTLEKSDEAPSLVLRLSEILDYILYRCEEKRVLLSEEIQNLINYIEIEKIRYSEKLKLELNTPDNPGQLKIAPLILLPFIENAFKHGVSNHPDVGFVSLFIRLNNNQLEFKISNTKPLIKIHKKKKGIGLTNAKKRLEMIYPTKHNLIIEDGKEEYSVNLTIDLED